MELKNIILRRVSIFECSHSQGHLQTFSVGQTRSALSLEADVVNRSAMSPQKPASFNQFSCLFDERVGHLDANGGE
jgi:hypothetical protein